MKLSALAVIIAVVVFACWLPVLMQQSETGRPYLWIDKPDLPQLLITLFSTPLSMWVALVELVCLMGAAIGALRTCGGAGCRTCLESVERQPARYLSLVALSISGATIAAWVVSILVFPIFVPRYFAPQLMIAFALHVAFCELMVRVARRRLRFDDAPAAPWAAMVLPVLFGLTLLRAPAQEREPCTTADNTYFEANFVDGTLPVIAESPHVFLPRASYAAHPDAYRFPLDWDVVLKYPHRSHGNATEFHIMRHLKAWQPEAAIITTDELVKSTPQFLVIELSGKAWFHHLRQTMDVSAEKLAEISSGAPDGTCTLWKVAHVKARS